MKSLIVFFALSCVSVTSCYASNDSVKKILDSLPLWGGLGSDQKSAKKLEEIETKAKTLNSRQPAELRTALFEYLTQCSEDPMETSYRLDNARIVVAIYYKVPRNHVYAEYFEPKADSQYKIRKPFFAADLGRGRDNGATGIKQLLDEFDRLQGMIRGHR